MFYKFFSNFAPATILRKVKGYVHILLLSLLYAAFASAQNPLSLDSVRLTQDSGVVQLSADIGIGKKLPRGNVYVITPRLMNGNDSIDFPQIVSFGRNAYYHDARQETVTEDIRPDAYRIRQKNGPRTEHYARSVAYQPWMEGAHLKLVVSEGTPCNLKSHELSVAVQYRKPENKTAAAVGRRDSVEKKITNTVSGQAKIQFIVNRTEYRPDKWNNRFELEKMRKSYEDMLRNPDVRITEYKIKGYASPEGPYLNNVRLAKGRTARLRDFMLNDWGVPKDIFKSEYQPEDWEGFRKYMVAHHDEFPDADEIIRLIDKEDTDLDHKLTVIKKRHPESYRRILRDCFPALRRTDYDISYEWTKTVKEPQAPQTGEARVKEAATEPLLEDNVLTPYTPTRPWIAVKTNMLFDALVTPNIEVELPLGQESRWSIMAEYWNPWYVWHHNSRAYEIQLFGVEGRYWFSPKCQLIRPTLTGSFVGVYYANGKYDIEWNSVGDQGEFNSFGVTYGYSWPLSLHLNLEASVSAGIFFGPRRHYHGEYDDTHLMWKYTGSTFYAGPTKLKVSIVWLINKNTFKRKKAKGGVL